MGVNDAHLRNLTAREVISALIRDGFSFDRGAGSHQVYYHPDGRDTFAHKTNTVHFGGADHRTSWSAAIGERWQTT